MFFTAVSFAHLALLAALFSVAGNFVLAAPTPTQVDAREVEGRGFPGFGGRPIFGGWPPYNHEGLTITLDTITINPYPTDSNYRFPPKAKPASPIPPLPTYAPGLSGPGSNPGPFHFGGFGV